MKTCATFFCWLWLAGAGCLSLASAQDAKDVSTETLASVVDKNYAARGGLAAWRSIDSLQIIGQMALPDGVMVPVALEMKRPNRLRMEFQLQGMTGIRTYDGTEGWSMMPFDENLNAVRMTPEEAADLAGLRENELAGHSGPS